MSPEFAAAVRPLILGARENGWQRGSVQRQATNDTHKVIYTDGWIAVRTYSADRSVYDTANVRVTSTQQAIDVLVALGVLPPHFSSVYGVGHERGRDQAIEALVRSVLTPDDESIEAIAKPGRFVDDLDVRNRVIDRADRVPTVSDHGVAGYAIGART